eukprot:13633-Heterococcus_DN1.PRE.3
MDDAALSSHLNGLLAYGDSSAVGSGNSALTGSVLAGQQHRRWSALLYCQLCAPPVHSSPVELLQKLQYSLVLQQQRQHTVPSVLQTSACAHISNTDIVFQ